MSAAQLAALQALADAPADSLQSLAARTFTRHSSASVVVKRLVDLGYVARRRSRADARRVTFALTPAGRRLVRAVPEAAHAIISDSASRLSIGRLRSIAHGLRALAHEMSSAREGARTPVTALLDAVPSAPDVRKRYT